MGNFKGQRENFLTLAVCPGIPSTETQAVLKQVARARLPADGRISEDGEEGDSKARSLDM